MMSSATARRTGVIGLGAMGLPMAASLAPKGFRVTAFDLDAGRRAKGAEAGLGIAASPRDMVRASEVVVFFLPAAQHVRSVVEASGLLSEDMPRRIVVDASTSEPGVSRALAATLAAKGHGFLDAPVSGGPAGSAAGALSFMVGGDDALRVVNAASGRSMLSEVHFPNWVLSGSFSSGFGAGLMRKDVRLALGLVEAVGGGPAGRPPRPGDLVGGLGRRRRRRLHPGGRPAPRRQTLRGGALT